MSLGRWMLDFVHVNRNFAFMVLINKNSKIMRARFQESHVMKIYDDIYLTARARRYFWCNKFSCEAKYLFAVWIQKHDRKISFT